MLTTPFVAGCHDVSGAPVASDTAASPGESGQLTAQSPTVRKTPPRYMVEAVAARPTTMAGFVPSSSKCGSHGVAAPVDASNAAAALRARPPPAVVNAPPAYSIEPECVSA